MLVIDSLQLIQNVENMIRDETILKHRMGHDRDLQDMADDTLSLLHTMLAEVIRQHMLIVECTAATAALNASVH